LVISDKNATVKNFIRQRADDRGGVNFRALAVM
jgi:hypothetical protein